MSPFLPLGRTVKGEDTVLVRAADGFAPNASGDGRLPREEARRLFESASLRALDTDQIRQFAGCARLVDDVWRLDDGQLRELLLLQIDRGELVAMGPGADSSVDAAVVENRRLADDIRSALAGREFRFGSGSYALMLGVDLARLRARGSFVVLARVDAARLLSVEQAGMSDRLRALLLRARDLLATDEKTPEPGHFVLIARRRLVAIPSTVDATVLTPSQVRKLTEKTWIEIEVAFEDGEPYSGNVEVRLADGSLQTAATNAQGILRLEGITPGTCKVSFPDVDAASWAPA